VDRQGDNRSDRAIITPAPHRTLILVKVPCSIVLVSGVFCSRHEIKRAGIKWRSVGRKGLAKTRGRIAANIAKLLELDRGKASPKPILGAFVLSQLNTTE
jgi:hypothetical protein